MSTVDPAARQTIELAEQTPGYGPYGVGATVVGRNGNPIAARGCTVTDETVATAEVSWDNRVILTSRQVGSTTLTVETDEGPQVAEVRVVPTPPDKGSLLGRS